MGYIEDEHQAIINNADVILPAYLKRCGLPPRAVEANPKKIPKPISEALPREFATAIKKDELPRQGFGLSGKVGCGKTMTMGIVARRIAWSFIKKNSQVNGEASLYLKALQWCNWPEMAERLKSTATVNFHKCDDLIRELTEAKVLFLDDLGVERIKENYREDFSAQRLDHIVDARYSENRVTFYTTNLDHTDLVRNYGTRLVSRLLGLNPLIVLPSLPDLRMQTPTHRED